MASDVRSAGRESIGVDIGGSYIKWVLLRDGETVHRGEEPTSREGTDAVRAQVGAIVQGTGARWLGLAVPGPVGSDGRIDFVPNVPGDWTDGSFAPRLQQDCRIAVSALNDAVAHAIAEMSLEPATGDSALIVLGTGVGGALIVNGQPLRGGDGRAGEIGHTVVHAGGRRCPCGGRGCLEAYASVTSMVELGVAEGLPVAGLEQLLDFASRQDPRAVRVMETAGSALGAAIATVSALISVDTVIIGGGGVIAMDHLESPIRRVLDARNELRKPPAIRVSRLGRYAGAVGAALHAAASSEEDRA